MNGPQVLLLFDRDRRVYQPEDVLSGEYRLRGIEPRDIKAIELSVLWYTEGKGDEDLAVHFFERVEPEIAAVDLEQPRVFSIPLPPSPLSYAGVIVKISWCARVRVFLPQGKELLAEESFRLGEIPAAHEVLA